MKKIIFIGLLFVFCHRELKCQQVQLRFDNYSTLSGLSNNECSTVIQDSRGFIWTATRNGLNRFDGISFQNFYHSSSDSNSLSGNIINSMVEMPGGLLVIGTNEGLCIYNIYKNCFENFKIKRRELVSGANIFIRNTLLDADKNLWVNYNGIIDVFDSLLNYKFRLTDSPEGAILKGIVIHFNYSTIDGKGNLWIPSDNMGIVIVESKTGKITCSKNSTDSLFIGTAIRGFCLDTLKKIVWFSPWGYGLLKYDLTTKKISRYLFPTTNVYYSTYNTINGIVLTGNTLLLGSEIGGLFDFNIDNGKITPHPHDIYNSVSISSNEINRMFTDRDKNLWVSSNEGLSKTSLMQSPFHYFSNEFRTDSHEPFPTLLSFALYDSHFLLTGTETKGLFALNMETGETQQQFNKEPSHINENIITRLYVDNNKNIWVGTGEGLFIYNIKQNTLLRPDSLNSELPQNEVTTIFQDSYGDYWFSFRAKIVLVHYSAHENKITKCFFEDIANENKSHPAGERRIKFPLSYVSKIREDKNGNLWLSSITSQGFLMWNRSSDSFSHYPKTENKDENLSEEISDILPDTGNIVWLASYSGHGLIRYNYLTNTSVSLSRNEGLCNENVKSITRDDKGNLWLGTQDGLSVFNPEEKEFKNFDEGDGLPGNVFLRTSFYDATQKNIYLITSNTIIYFNPAELTDKKALEKIYIQKIQVNGKDTAAGNVNRLKLSYNHNYINFEFTCVNFVAGSKTKFAYMLDGLDKDWNYCGNRRFASYSNLAPGNYTFKVKASSGNNIWSDEVKTISISITPPFWSTWWFRILFILSFSGILFYIIRRRIRLIRFKAKEKTAFDKQLAEVEMKALRAQMNPHFIFNSLNSIHRFILSNDTEKASHYLTTFSKLIRLILENSEKQSIPLETEIELLNIYLALEENRFKTKFEYSVHVDRKIDQQRTEIPPMLIQPYVENAIWHGLLHKETKGEVKISFNRNGNGIECIIEDNGIGREKSMELKQQTIVKQKSMGMKVSQERLNLLGTLYRDKPSVSITDLKNINGEVTGTRVEIHIPVEE